jgi:hypothetical protein
MPAAIAKSLRVTAPRRLSPKNFARTSASVAFANSDGCRFMGPRSIHRREPPRTTPNTSTPTSSATIAM